MMRTLLKGLASLASGIACGLIVELAGTAALFGGLGVRPYYWTQLQIWGMVVVAAVAGLVGAIVSILTARKINLQSGQWLVLLLLYVIFPGLRVWEYYSVRESPAMVFVAAVLGAGAILIAIPLERRISRFSASPVRRAA